MVSNFEATYYGVTGALTLILIYTTILGFRIRSRLTNNFYRHGALGIGLAACGFAVAVIGGVSVNIISKSILIGDVLYQQARFSFFCIGFSMILYGIDALVLTVQKSGHLFRNTRRFKQVRFSLWALFGVALSITACYLFNPNTYTFTQTGTGTHAAQQRVFFLPLFLTLIIGAAGLPFVALNCEDSSLRRHVIWFGLFASFSTVGLLREATIIPSSTNPIIDLLAVFVPFTIGGLCLFMSARSLLYINKCDG